ncbi:GNAT family N-acetyltransferase [Rheinheimera riviphila]|uniref:GNAT family N-acetyltransferase n=1 Tax=Rheinheimera riviphila TaxID=1834037 RepID=UPI0013E30D1E|nr:GNAT family N-acetyltransferase [Rheinheimera riviphila]
MLLKPIPDNLVLQSERLTLRRFTSEDVEVFFRINSEPDLVQYTTRAALTSLDEAATTLESTHFRADESVGLGRFACVEKSTGLVVGIAGLRPAPEHDSFAFGYRILPEYWGRGFATEAATTLLQYGYGMLQLDKIVATVFPKNLASQRVLEKLGLVFEKEVILADSPQILWLYQPPASA